MRHTDSQFLYTGSMRNATYITSDHCAQLDPIAGVALGFKIRGHGMTPETARNLKKMGVKMQTLRVIMCPGIPLSSKKGL